MLNQWRYAGYADDGCDRYECLKCYNTWESRTPAQTYCQFCGTKWDGQVATQTQENPNGYNERKLKAIHASRLSPNRYKCEVWIIEERWMTAIHKYDADGKYIGPEFDAGPWGYYTYVEGKEPAKYVLERLKSNRQYSMFEYQNQINHGVTPWGYSEFRVKGKEFK